MISVTVAAHGGRSKRVVGGHLKAYGSGRLSICDLDIPPEKRKIHKPHFWHSVFTKIFSFAFTLLQSLFPFIGRLLQKDAESTAEARLEARRVRANRINKSPTPLIFKLNEKCLLKIFKYLNGQTIIACESTCRRWKKVVDSNVDSLPKVTKDQIRILFDEGEIVIYPVDERKTPTRYPMPNLQRLEVLLRHLETLSLFVRGLIPIETSPVLNSLRSLRLKPQQIYFIWSKFNVESMHLLEDFIYKNAGSLTDIGFEECSPAPLLSDQLFAPIISQIQSLRIWNDSKSGFHGLTDATIHKLAENLLEGKKLEMLDLSSCRISSKAIQRLVIAWSENPPCDLSITLNGCPSVHREEVLNQLSRHNVDLANGKIARYGFALTLFC